MFYLNTSCPITKKPVRLLVDCPRVHFEQISRFALTPTDAVAIAESRYQKAVKLRKLRARKREINELEDFFLCNS